MSTPRRSPALPSAFAAVARVLGIALVALGLLIGVGTEYHMRDQSRWASDLIASPTRADDPAVQASARYHLARVTAQRRARWSLFGHGTWSLLCIVGGGALLWRGSRRRATALPA